MNSNNTHKSPGSSTSPYRSISEGNTLTALKKYWEDSDRTPTYEDYEEFFADLDDPFENDDSDGALYDDSFDDSYPEEFDDQPQSTYQPYEDDSFDDACAEVDANSDVATKSKLVWNEGNQWTVKREYFSFNNPSSSPTTPTSHYDCQITLNFNQKEWDRLVKISEKFGMPVEDYIECCALKIQPLPFGATNNQELWKRLLNFQDKLVQFENLLEFCSEDLKNNVFRSEPILRYCLQRFNEAYEQIDMLFHLMYLFGRNDRTGAL